jgi:NADPH-dependent ferric siderophore reductase
MARLLEYQEVRVSGFDAELSRQIAETAEHANDEHADTVRLLARYGGDASARVVEDAQFAAFDPNGFEIRVVDAAGNLDTVRRLFPAAVTASDVVWEYLIAALLRARQAAPPDEPITLLEEELAQETARLTHVTTVARVRDVSPSIREVTFQGGLDRYEARGPGEFLTVLFPPESHEDVLAAGLDFSALAAMPEEQRPQTRTYTVRAWRPEQRELDVWFVLHDHASVASDWARRARPGHRVGIRGPRLHIRPPEDTSRIVLLGDETFLPATVAALEALPDGVAVDVLLETAGAAHAVPLPERPGTTVRWLDRGDTPAGTSPVLLEAVRALAVDPDGIYVCGGGEAIRMTEIRKHLRADRAIPSTRVSVVGYWRRDAH